MDAGVRRHRVEHAKLVRMTGEIWQQFRNPQPALPAPLECRDRPGVRIPAHLRLVIKGVHLRRPASHVQEDHALRPRPESRRSRVQTGIRGSRDSRHRQIAESAGSGAQHLASGEMIHRRIHTGQSVHISQFVARQQRLAKGGPGVAEASVFIVAG